MPTAVWSGTISFSLVSVPVQLYSVAENVGPELHQYHAADGGRIRYKRICEIDKADVPLEEIARGYEAGGDMAIITDRDLDSLPDVVKKTITIEAFVPEGQIDPIQYRKAYYIAPEKAGIRPYMLMRDALRNAGRAAVTKFAMRERESLALVRADGNLLVLESLWWPDEVREVPVEAPPAVDDEAEAKAMSDLIAAMSEDFDVQRYRNRYAAALQEVIDAKAAGREVKHAPAPAPTTAGKVGDLLAALRASVERAKETRGEEQEPAPKKRTKKAA
jgi:DNA end-binding protein Ku